MTDSANKDQNLSVTALGQRMTVTLLIALAAVHVMGVTMRLLRDFAFPLETVLAIAGLVYLVGALIALRFAPVYRAVLLGVLVYLALRAGLIWSFATGVNQILVTALMVALFFPLVLACGLMQGWSRRLSFSLIAVVGLLPLLISQLREDSYEFYLSAGIPPGLFSIGFIVTTSVLASFLHSWRVSQEQLSLSRRRSAELSSLAATDPLTGVLNRRAGEDLLADELNTSADLTIAMVDLDHFKPVNDQYGHIEGDKVLKKIAAELKGVLRHDEKLVRWGGDEFLVIMSDTSAEDAMKIAERMREAIADFKEPPCDQITTSIGLATAESGDSIRALIGRADDAMYQAKSAGRNRVGTYREVKSEVQRHAQFGAPSLATAKIGFSHKVA